MKGKKITGIFLFLAAVVSCFMLRLTVNAQEGYDEDNNNRILFISSYSYGRDVVQLEIEGMQSAIPDNFIVDYEFMDTYRVHDDTSSQLFYEGIKYRLSMVEPYDAIIVGDDAALRFAMQYRDELFSTQPIFYIGINDEKLAEQLEDDPNVKGIVEKLDIKTNIKKALEIYPDADTVVVIVDSSLSGEIERKNYREVWKEFPELTFREINPSKMTQEKLRQSLKEIPENAILIYYSMNEDKEGKQYTNQEAINFISLYVDVPIFYMVKNEKITEGVLGGYAFSLKESGRYVAQAAVDVVNGKRKMEYVEFSRLDLHNWYIDVDVLKKFGISRKLFPDDTVYIHEEPSFWENNNEVITPIIIVIVVLVSISGWLCIDNIKRRKLMKEMKEMKEHLENASQHDFLTGLPNRSKFMADLQEVIARKQPCTVIMLDLDNFKGINDTMGHAMGDEALKGVASRLKALRTPLLTAYRFAGDEFILILRSDNVKISENAVMQCLQVFRKPYKMMGKTMDIHGSIGAASYPSDTQDMETLIVCADNAMYAIKKEGKNGYLFYKDMQKK